MRLHNDVTLTLLVFKTELPCCVLSSTYVNSIADGVAARLAIRSGLGRRGRRSQGNTHKHAVQATTPR